jgi:hypothetical protein
MFILPTTATTQDGGHGTLLKDHTTDWRKERFISHASCTWPFRVRVDALQLTTQFLQNQVSE